MKIYNSLKSTFKISLLTIIGICNFCYINSANSGIISEPTVDIINPTGWIALQGQDLARNQKLFDSKCEYRATRYNQSVLTPITIWGDGTGLTLKTSSKNCLAKIFHNSKHILVICNDGNMCKEYRTHDSGILKIEERCPNYMEIYLNHKFSTMFHSMQSIMSSSNNSPIVDNEQKDDQ